MPSRKGISGAVIMMIIAIVGGIIALVILVGFKQAILLNSDFTCLIGNSLSNIGGGVGGSYCKTEVSTIRAPDLSDTQLALRDCPALKEGIEEFEYAQLLSTPNEFIKKCVAEQIIQESENCWNNYLGGEAKFDGVCDDICFAKGFSSYLVEDKDGTITIPSVEDREIFVHVGKFNPRKFTLRELDSLITIDEANTRFASKIKFQQSENTISWSRQGRSRTVFAIVVASPIDDVTPDYIKEALTQLNNNPEKSSIKTSEFRIEEEPLRHSGFFSAETIHNIKQGFGAAGVCIIDGIEDQDCLGRHADDDFAPNSGERWIVEYRESNGIIPFTKSLDIEVPSSINLRRKGVC